MQRVLTFILLLYPLFVWTQLPDGRNHPELDWKVIHTPHFEIIYHQTLDSLAIEAGRIAERIYGPFTKDFGVTPRDKTVIILFDVDDISNGIANPFHHTIFIWARPPKKETTGRLRWLERVIAHEFAHILTFWGSRNFLGKPWELLTLATTPTWYLEGVAQFEAEQWDFHRDLLLRVATHSGTLLLPKQLDGFVGGDMVDSRLVYEEGHGLIRYMASRYGKEKVTDLLKKHRQFPIAFTWAMKRTLGKTTGRFFKEWQSVVGQYTTPIMELKQSADQIGQRIRVPLQVTTGVRYSKAGQIAVVGIERWDEGVQRLYLLGQEGGGLKRLGGSHVCSYFSWSSDGRKIVISRKRRGERGAIVDDLFIIDINQAREKRITDNARATDPVWSPVRDEICFVRHFPGSSRLWLFDLEKHGMKEIGPSDAGAEVYAPSWSPDGERIVFSLFDQYGNRDIAIIDRTGSNFKRLTQDPTDDRTPVWSPDGEWVGFCSYNRGTSNLQKMRLDGTQRVTLTDLAGGCFNPAWLPGGESMTIVVFERRDSVIAYTVPVEARIEQAISSLSPTGLFPQPSGFEDSLGSTRREWDFSSPKSYWPLFHIKPLLTIPYFGRDDGGIQFGLYHYAADPLDKYWVQGALTARKRVDWWMESMIGHWEPFLYISCWGNTLDRGKFLGLSEYPLWERKIGASMECLWPINFGRSLLSNHLVYAWGEIERTDLLQPERFYDILPQFRPSSGWQNTLGLGYGWVWERPDVGYDIHPVTGYSVGFSLSRSDPLWRSDIECTRVLGHFVYRQELPWKRHVVGARVRGFFQWGDQPIQDLMSLDTPNSVRCVSIPREGDRFLYGSLEYRIPLLRDLGFRIPILYFERFTWSFWTDWGRAWGRDLFTYDTGTRRSFGETVWVVTVGGELRSRIYLLGKFPLVFRGGYGKELDISHRGSWYWLLGGVF